MSFPYTFLAIQAVQSPIKEISLRWLTLSIIHCYCPFRAANGKSVAILKNIIILTLFALVLSASSCEPQVQPVDPPTPEQERHEGQLITDAPKNPLASSADEADMYAIKDLWLIDVADILQPPHANAVYLVKLENDKRFYLRRYNFSGELKIGDKIAFSYFDAMPEEIAKVKQVKTGNGEPAKQNVMAPASGSTLEVSLPIQTYVKDLFVLKMRHTKTFTLKETVFIETKEGNMVYIDKAKLAGTNAQDLKVGDLFNYNFYTIFPNMVYNMRKVNLPG